MTLAYSYRLRPTDEQVQALARAFGCARVVYNDAITLRREAYQAGEPFVGDTVCQGRVITEAKKTPDRSWLGEVSSGVLVQALADQHRAWRNFFVWISGTRKGRKVGPPPYRSKKDRRQTIRLTRNGFTVRPDGRLCVAKVGDLAVVWTRPLPSAPSSVTVVKDAAGRYPARFVVEVAEQSTQPVVSEVCPRTRGLFRLTLADRWWDRTCGVRHDRDVAAAEVILAAGRAERLNACPPSNRRGEVRPGMSGQTSKQEVAA